MNESAGTRHDQTSLSKCARAQRTLKIELLGDLWRGKTFSVIRLKGHWLAAAGFPAGQSVTVSVVSPGVMELRVSRESEDAVSRQARLQVQDRIDQALTRAKSGVL
jgi:hypothetical protein